MNPDTCPTRPTRWSTLSDAAAELGVSTRTVHRRIRSGAMTGRLVDGRTLVAMPDDVTPGTVGAVMAGVQQQVETTDRLATGLLAVAERNLQFMATRAERAERSVASLRRVAVAACVLGVAGIAWAVATARQASDTLTALDATRTALAQQGQHVADATRLRHLSEEAAAAAIAERDALVADLVALRSTMSDTMSPVDDCPVDLASR